MCWARPEYRGAVSPPRKFPAKVPAAARARYAKRRKNRLARVDNDLTVAERADHTTPWLIPFSGTRPRLGWCPMRSCLRR